MSEADDIALDYLPGVLRELAKAAGVTPALLLARCYGGLELYVPRKLRPGHPLAEAIGGAAAAVMVALYGGGHVEVPMGPDADSGRKRRQIVRLIDQGKTNPQIARAVHCHIRTVRRVRNADRSSGRQPDFFR